MNKIKIILGMLTVSALAMTSLSGNAMATSTVINKLEVSYPAAIGATVPDGVEITAYVDNVAQSAEIVATSTLNDAHYHSVPAGSTFEKKGYALGIVASAPSGYTFACNDDDFDGDIVVNGQTIAGSDLCTGSKVIFYAGFEFRDYYDITKLNFDVRYPLITSTAGDFNVTQLSSLNEVMIDDGGWYRYDTNCDFNGNLEDIYTCWYDNGIDMDDGDTFNYSEQYTYVFIISHPNYYFHNITPTQTFTELPKYANINNIPTLTGLWTDFAVDNEYFVFVNIPALKDHLTVTFNTQGIGIAPEAQDITPNTTITEPTVTADDYTFEGWYYDEDCTLPVDFNMIITNDVTFYAKWSSTVIGVPNTGVETRNLSATTTNLITCVLTGAIISGITAFVIMRKRN